MRLKLDLRTKIIWILGILVIIESIICISLVNKKNVLQEEAREKMKGYLSDQVLEKVIGEEK